jgi:hypothetical protein
MVMERQAERMQAAESARQGACSTGPREECSALASTAQSEASLYQKLQDRYRLCLQRSRAVFAFTGYGFGGYSSDFLIDSLEFDSDY